MSLRALAALVVLAVLAAACTETVAVGATTPTASPSMPAETAAPAGDLSKLDQARQHLEHLIFIVQENRSFDHYFGTYPGAKGIPMTAAGKPEPCIPDPSSAAASGRSTRGTSGRRVAPTRSGTRRWT